MSGMPAWSYRLSDEDLWAVVGFVSRMSEMSPTDYGVLMDTVQAHQCRAPYEGAAQPVATSLPPDELARSVLRQYACVSCHTIPGVTGGQARVGPPLDGFSGKTIPSTPCSMVSAVTGVAVSAGRPKTASAPARIAM